MPRYVPGTWHQVPFHPPPLHCSSRCPPVELWPSTVALHCGPPLWPCCPVAWWACGQDIIIAAGRPDQTRPEHTTADQAGAKTEQSVEPYDSIPTRRYAFFCHVPPNINFNIDIQLA